MRIFCAVQHSKDSRYYYGGLWSGNFYPALRELGHEIVESHVDLLPLSRFMHVPGDFTPEEIVARSEITQRVVAEVHQAHRQRPLDLFLSYFYNAHFDPAGFDEPRRLGIPSINFYCNSIYQFPLVAEIASKVDYSWHPEKHAHELYLNVGGRPVWVQMAADPEVYHPIAEIRREASACFVGQRYADRDRWLAALHDANVPFDIFGAGWSSVTELEGDIAAREEVYLGRRQYRPGNVASYAHAIHENIEREGLIGGLTRTAHQWQYRRATQKLTPKVAAHAKGRAKNIATTLAAHEVCLNFSNVWSDGRQGSTLISHIRLRDFEAPMCRTCYLTGDNDEIREFYEVGKEIDTYQTGEELVEKARFYLTNSGAAEKLRNAGYERARRDHTWKRRFEELFRKIGTNRVS